MAVFKLFKALGERGLLSDVIDGTTLGPVAFGSDFLTLADRDGDTVTFTGTGLTYGVGTVTGGTITGVSAETAADAKLVTVRGLSLQATEIVAGLSDGVDGAVALLLGGNDRWTGSPIGDSIASGPGDDTIKGGSGRDRIEGGAGDDVLSGGGGRDTFVFFKGDGTDTLLDFSDDRLLGADDVIGVTRAMYRNMVVTQVDDDLHLDFGRNSTLILQNMEAEQLDRSDFIFVTPI